MKDFWDKLGDNFGVGGIFTVLLLIAVCAVITVIVWVELMVNVSVLFAVAPFIALYLIFRVVNKC